MNRFSVGDRVVCRIGGPVMLVSFAPGQIPNPGFIPMYGCVWWNDVAQIFGQWNFSEPLLDAAPPVVDEQRQMMIFDLFCVFMPVIVALAGLISY